MNRTSELDSMNPEELWNFFRQEVNENECPEDFFNIFNGIKIKFEIVRYFNGEGIYPKEFGTKIIIKKPNGKFSRWEFEQEINARTRLMKEILEEKFKREPIAMVKALSKFRGDDNEE